MTMASAEEEALADSVNAFASAVLAVTTGASSVPAMEKETALEVVTDVATVSRK